MDTRLDDRNPMLIQAIDYLNSHPKASIRSVALDYGVDKSTLSRHRVRPTSRLLGQESNQRFSWRQERFLVDWIIEEDMRGYAPSRTRVHEMAQKLLRANGDDKPLGKKWIEGFKRRNKDIKPIIGKRLASERYNGASVEVLEPYFQRFKQIVDTYAVKKENIWNMDETGTQLGASHTSQVLASAKKSSTRVKKPNETEWVSVIECGSAGGKTIRPLIIFKGKSVQLQWFNFDEVPDWQYTTSTNGWTSNDIGMKWLTSIFIPETATELEEYRILVVDAHGSHVTIDFMYECKRNKIQLVYLPPHTSHVTQPLDLTIFSAIKARYRSLVQELAALDDAAKVKKERFIWGYNKARIDSTTPRAISSGFKAAGLVPFNPDKVLNSSFVHQVEKTTTTPTKASGNRRIKSNSPRTPKRASDWSRIASDIGSRSARKLLRRTGRHFERLTIEITQKDTEIRQLQAKLTPFLNKLKRKKVPVAPQEQFVNIEAIKAAYEASKVVDRLIEERQEVYEQNHPQSEYEMASLKALELGYESMLSEFNLV
jgi:hypothetical protein